MSDHDDEPSDLFDVVCRLDDLVEWLEATGYDDEARGLRAVSDQLKTYIVISLPTASDAKPPPR